MGQDGVDIDQEGPETVGTLFGFGRARGLDWLKYAPKRLGGNAGIERTAGRA